MGPSSAWSTAPASCPLPRGQLLLLLVLREWSPAPTTLVQISPPAEGDGPLLGAGDHPRFRRGTNIALYLEQFRRDIEYHVRLPPRDVAPTEGSRPRFKGLGWCLAGTRGLVQGARRPTSRVLEMLSGSDWAGCRHARKSASAGLGIMAISPPRPVMGEIRTDGDATSVCMQTGEMELAFVWPPIGWSRGWTQGPGPGPGGSPWSGGL